MKILLYNKNTSKQNMNIQYSIAHHTINCLHYLTAFGGVAAGSQASKLNKADRVLALSFAAFFVIA